jgi:hypothetical protein
LKCAYEGSGRHGTAGLRGGRGGSDGRGQIGQQDESKHAREEEIREKHGVLVVVLSPPGGHGGRGDHSVGSTAAATTHRSLPA